MGRLARLVFGVSTVFASIVPLILGISFIWHPNDSNYTDSAAWFWYLVGPIVLVVGVIGIRAGVRMVIEARVTKTRDPRGAGLISCL